MHPLASAPWPREPIVEPDLARGVPIGLAAPLYFFREAISLHILDRNVLLESILEYLNFATSGERRRIK